MRDEWKKMTLLHYIFLTQRCHNKPVHWIKCKMTTVISSFLKLTAYHLGWVHFHIYWAPNTDRVYSQHQGGKRLNKCDLPGTYNQNGVPKNVSACKVTQLVATYLKSPTLKTTFQMDILMLIFQKPNPSQPESHMAAGQSQGPRSKRPVFILQGRNRKDSPADGATNGFTGTKTSIAKCLCCNKAGRETLSHKVL